MQKRPRIWLVWVQKSLPPKSLFWDFGGSSDPPPPRKDFNSFTISTFLVIAGDPEITRIVEISLDRGPFQESLDPPKSQKRVQVLNPERQNRRSLLHSRKSQFSQIGCNARGPPSDPSSVWELLSLVVTRTTLSLFGISRSQIPGSGIWVELLPDPIPNSECKSGL